MVLVMGFDGVHWSYDTLDLAGMLPEHVDYLNAAPESVYAIPFFKCAWISLIMGYSDPFSGSIPRQPTWHVMAGS